MARRAVVQIASIGDVAIAAGCGAGRGRDRARIRGIDGAGTGESASIRLANGLREDRSTISGCIARYS
jgi:hypothetical protein